MDVLLVPSADVKPIDSLVGTVTLQRLEKAMELWRTGQYDLIVLSGGFVQPASVQTRPHAEIMRQWVLQQPDAPADQQIIVEDKAHDTYQNAWFSHDKIEENIERRWSDADTLTITTEERHGRRFTVTFPRAISWNDIVIVSVGTLSLLGRIREFALYLMHVVDPAGNGLLARLNRNRRAKR